MPKAATNIRHGRGDGSVYEVPAGEDVDTKQFSKEQYAALVETGAIQGKGPNAEEEVAGPEASGGS